MGLPESMKALRSVTPLSSEAQRYGWCKTKENCWCWTSDTPSPRSSASSPFLSPSFEIMTSLSKSRRAECVVSWIWDVAKQQWNVICWTFSRNRLAHPRRRVHCEGMHRFIYTPLAKPLHVDFERQLATFTLISTPWWVPVRLPLRVNECVDLTLIALLLVPPHSWYVANVHNHGRSIFLLS